MHNKKYSEGIKKSYVYCRQSNVIKCQKLNCIPLQNENMPLRGTLAAFLVRLHSSGSVTTGKDPAGRLRHSRAHSSGVFPCCNTRGLGALHGIWPALPFNGTLTIGNSEIRTQENFYIAILSIPFLTTVERLLHFFPITDLMAWMVALGYFTWTWPASTHGNKT